MSTFSYISTPLQSSKSLLSALNDAKSDPTQADKVSKRVNRSFSLAVSAVDMEIKRLLNLQPSNQNRFYIEIIALRCSVDC